MGVLVQQKRTIRFALLPIALLCAYRASSVLDFSFEIPKYRHFNQKPSSWAFANKWYKQISPKYDTNNQSTDVYDTQLSGTYGISQSTFAGLDGIGHRASKIQRAVTRFSQRLGSCSVLSPNCYFIDATSGPDQQSSRSSLPGQHIS